MNGPGSVARSALGRSHGWYRRLTAASMYRAGWLSRRTRSRLSGRAVVLMYHRVVPHRHFAGCPSHPGIVVSAESFAKHVRYLSERIHPLDETALLEGLAGDRPFPATGSCMVTFDDGWRDNLTHALPILEARGVPALIFLATGYVGTGRRFWQETVTAALLRARSAAANDPETRRRLLRDPVAQVPAACLATSAGRSREAIREFVSAQKSISRAELDARVGRIRELTGPAPDADRDFLDWDEVSDMEARGIRFGPHGRNHLLLTRPDTDLESEVGDSIRDLRSRLRHPSDSFCYPNGDFDDRVVEAVRRHGCRLAFTTVPGSVAPGDAPFTLRRQNVHEGAAGPLPMFLARLAGLW